MDKKESQKDDPNNIMQDHTSNKPSKNVPGIPSNEITKNSDSNSPVFNNETASCKHCGKDINDYYLLTIAPGMKFHVDCLNCTECGNNLEKNTTCFVREGKLYCKKDYDR